jgi:DinB family protein
VKVPLSGTYDATIHIDTPPRAVIHRPSLCGSRRRAERIAARFVRADLSGVVMRAVDVSGADIDAPWLFEGESSLRVNGVDVIPLVEAELNRRFPGRADRRAGDPDGLRSARATLERTWAATLERVAPMPAGTVDVPVGGEWSFAQTLRHPGHGHGRVTGRVDQ